MTALTEGEKVDIRRHCGYPAASLRVSGLLPLAFAQTSDLLEFRIANLSDAELAIIRRYLTSLSALEAAVPDAASNLDTDQASVWTRNRTEVEDRLRLLDEWRRRLCGFTGIPPGPSLTTHAGRLIV